MVRISLIPLLLLQLLPLGGCMAIPSNAATFDSLWQALQDGDRSVLPMVQVVLEDSLHHGNRFNYETRKTAFEVLRATSMTELLPLVRQVASMDYRTLENSPKGELVDLVAIQEALITLSEWQDPSAIELSLQRLVSDPWLQTTAVNNLRHLKHWQATSEIQRLVGQSPKDLENLVLLRKSVEFLRDSPNTELVACDSLLSLRASFPFCFQNELERWRCGTLSEDTRTLRSRLNCKGGGYPALNEVD